MAKLDKLFEGVRNSNSENVQKIIDDGLVNDTNREGVHRINVCN